MDSDLLDTYMKNQEIKKKRNWFFAGLLAVMVAICVVVVRKVFPKDPENPDTIDPTLDMSILMVLVSLTSAYLTNFAFFMLFSH